MQRNLIFFDVDGTIITADNFIPSSAVEAVRRAQAAGNLCVVNTGRPFAHLVPSVCDMGFSGYVCSCGQHIILHDQVLLHETFSPEQAAEIISMIRQCRLEAILESEQGVWFLRAGEPSRQLRENALHFREMGFETEGPVDVPGFSFDKFCVWPGPDSDRNRFLSYIAPLAEIIFRENNLIELVQKGFSKETGIRFLMERLGIPEENCYVLGDSTNDLPMFRCVRNSIAMGGAPEEVKAMAAYVTAPLLEAGLAKALDHFGLTG